MDPLLIDLLSSSFPRIWEKVVMLLLPDSAWQQVSLYERFFILLQNALVCQAFKRMAHIPSLDRQSR